MNAKSIRRAIRHRGRLILRHLLGGRSPWSDLRFDSSHAARRPHARPSGRDGWRVLPPLPGRWQ